MLDCAPWFLLLNQMIWVQKPSGIVLYYSNMLVLLDWIHKIWGQISVKPLVKVDLWIIQSIHTHTHMHAGGGGVLRTRVSKMLIDRNTRCGCSVTRTWNTWHLRTFNSADFNLTQMWPWYIKYLDNNVSSAQIIFHRDIDKCEPVCKYQKDINSAVILLRFLGEEDRKQGKWREGGSKTILEASDLVQGGVRLWFWPRKHTCVSNGSPWTEAPSRRHNTRRPVRTRQLAPTHISSVHGGGRWRIQPVL